MVSGAAVKGPLCELAVFVGSHEAQLGATGPSPADLWTSEAGVNVPFLVCKQCANRVTWTHAHLPDGLPVPGHFRPGGVERQRPIRPAQVPAQLQDADDPVLAPNGQHVGKDGVES